MSLFDKMFKKNAFDRKMDDVFDSFVENNPVMRKAKATINESKEDITRSLEREVYDVTGQRPQRHVPIDGDDDALMQEWDAMFDQVFDQKLGSIKICPSCGEAAPVELDRCPKCGAELPETTALDYINDLKF